MAKIEQTIADVNVRAHTFHFVTPSETDAMKIPNACNACHTDKTAAWATAALKTWSDRSLARRAVMLPTRTAGLAALFAASFPSNALAYRPFDSTDAAVADLGDFEVELSPLSYRHVPGGRVWITPELRLNYGFAENWEVVLEGQGEHPQFSGAESSLVENALSLKHILREGSLQDKEGPSIATELGLLLPGVNEQNGVGASVAGIIGQKFSWGAIHVNAAWELSRNHRGEVFFGTILEGPSSWAVRPVAEVIYQREFGLSEQVAALVGVIWQVKDNLAFDFAVREASANSAPETEVRAGVTFAFSVR
jgi:hypothetical protein